MKPLPLFIAFVIFGEVENFLQTLKRDSLQKAFVNISKALGQKNRLVTVVVDNSSRNKTSMASFTSLAEIPHIVASFDPECKNFSLKSSAIVSLNTMASFEAFNKRTRLPSTFSMQQQLFIHIENGT